MAGWSMTSASCKGSLLSKFRLLPNPEDGWYKCVVTKASKVWETRGSAGERVFIWDAWLGCSKTNRWTLGVCDDLRISAIYLLSLSNIQDIIIILKFIPANFMWEAWKARKKPKKKKTETKRFEAWQLWTCSCNYMWLLLVACTSTQEWRWQKFEERLDDIDVHGSRQKSMMRLQLECGSVVVWVLIAIAHLHVVPLSLPPVMGVFQPPAGPCLTVLIGINLGLRNGHGYLHDVSLLEFVWLACISMLASINGTIVNLLDETSVVSAQKKIALWSKNMAEEVIELDNTDLLV